MVLKTKIENEYERFMKEELAESGRSISLNQRRKKAEQMIRLHVAGSFTVGFFPIPFSDAPILIANQSALFARIMYIYGMDNLKDAVLSLVGQVGAGKLLSHNLANAAKYLTAQTLKFIPGIGTLAGGMINGTLAAGVTYAFGMAISGFCYQRIKNGNLIVSKEDIEGFSQSFNEAFARYCEKGAL